MEFPPLNTHSSLSHLESSEVSMALDSSVHGGDDDDFGRSQ